MAQMEKEARAKLLLLQYNKAERQELYKELHYFYKRFTNYLSISKEQIYQLIIEMAQKKYSLGSIIYQVRTKLISDIQKNAIKEGNYKLYTSLYNDTEKRVLGYLDRIEQIKKQMF